MGLLGRRTGREVRFRHPSVRSQHRLREQRKRPVKCPRSVPPAATPGSSWLSANKPGHASERRMPNSAALDPEREAQNDGQIPSQSSVGRDKIQPDDPDSDYSDECAIDDDDSADVFEQTLFQRIEPKVGLDSHCSLLTLLLKQKTHDRGVVNVVPQSTSVHPETFPSQPARPTLAISSNDSEDVPSMMSRDNSSVPLKSITEVPLFSARPVNATIDNDIATLSLLQTTGRNMIATEVTESVRKEVPSECLQKDSTANAVLEHLHTFHNVANLK